MSVEFDGREAGDVQRQGFIGSVDTRHTVGAT